MTIAIFKFKDLFKKISSFNNKLSHSFIGNKNEKRKMYIFNFVIKACN
jgi:hypothetical protein